MKLCAKLLLIVSVLCFVTDGSEVENLTRVVDQLSKRLDELEGKILQTTKSRQKDQVIFRGQPEIGQVFASGFYQQNQNGYGLNRLFDNDYTTYWHTEQEGGDYLKIRFNKTETLKKIDMIRCQNPWCMTNEVGQNRYSISVMLYKVKGSASLRLKREPYNCSRTLKRRHTYQY